MERLERLAGRLARNCDTLASYEAGTGDAEEFLEAASAVGGLTDELLSLSVAESVPVDSQPAPRMPLLESSRTVLLVEDEPADRAAIAADLESAGWQVLQAENGATAMSRAEAHRAPIHVLLANVILPDLSGRELAERLSLLRPEMSEIYMSGYTDEEVLFFGLLGPGMPVLQKPVRPAELHEMLARLPETQFA